MSFPKAPITHCKEETPTSESTDSLLRAAPPTLREPVGEACLWMQPSAHQFGFEFPNTKRERSLTLV